jgi:hypothetical protein
MRKPKPKRVVEAAVMVLHQRLAKIERRCRKCEHNRAPVGFSTECRGDMQAQDCDDPDVEELP